MNSYIGIYSVISLLQAYDKCGREKEMEAMLSTVKSGKSMRYGNHRIVILLHSLRSTQITPD